MSKPDLRAYFKSHLDDMVEHLSKHLHYETPTYDKAAVDAYSTCLREELEELEPDNIVVHPQALIGDFVEANWGSRLPGKPIVIYGHMDTVHPIGTLALNPVRVAEGKLYGPGSYDMKGGILTAIWALRALKTMNLFPNRPVTYLLTSDEESGSDYSEDLIVEKGQNAALACVLEGMLSNGAIKTWRKSPGIFRIRVYGKAAHAGVEPEAGINAVEEMAHQIIKLRELIDYPNGTTINCDVINGGTATNVIPDFCEMMVDARAATMTEARRVEKAILGLKPYTLGAKLEIEGRFDRPPMERDDIMMSTFERAQQIAKEYDLTLRHGESGGASDANFVAATGAPVLDGLGPQGQDAHTKQECVYISSLERSASLIAALLLEWPVVEVDEKAEPWH